MLVAFVFGVQFEIKLLHGTMCKDWLICCLCCLDVMDPPWERDYDNVWKCKDCQQLCILEFASFTNGKCTLCYINCQKYGICKYPSIKRKNIYQNLLEMYKYPGNQIGIHQKLRNCLPPDCFSRHYMFLFGEDQ